MEEGVLCGVFTSLWKSLQYKAAALVFLPTYENKFSDRSTWHKRGTPAVYLHLFMIFYYVKNAILPRPYCEHWGIISVFFHSRE